MGLTRNQLSCRVGFGYTWIANHIFHLPESVVEKLKPIKTLPPSLDTPSLLEKLGEGLVVVVV
jgi:hypothetical protein